MDDQSQRYKAPLVVLQSRKTLPEWYGHGSQPVGVTLPSVLLHIVLTILCDRPAANQSRTFETYKALAAQSPVNLGGDAVSAPLPGSNTTVPSPLDPNNPSTPGNGGVGSGTPTDGSVPTGTGATLPGNTGAAGSLRVGFSAALGVGAALGFAVLL